MRIKDIMRKDFLKLTADTSIEQAIRLLLKWNVSSSPVFEEGDFIGIVSLKTIVDKYIDYINKKKNLDEFMILAVSELVKKPTLVLDENQELNHNLVKKIAYSDTCIPVISNKKVIGLLRDKDMLLYLTTELALMKSKNQNNSITKETNIQKRLEELISQNSNSTMSLTLTTADKILQIVKTENFCTAKELAKRLNVSESSIEKISLALEKHKLIELEYDLLGNMIIKRKED
ncbi:MAG: CBS domain-containing protein [Candidatus Anstonellales archaeon]